MVDSIAARTEKRGSHGPSPVDRGTPGAKIDVLCDGRGTPLSVLISAANTHDSQFLLPLLDSITSTHCRRGRPRHRRAHRPQRHRLIPTPRPSSPDR
ncbi:transposase [Micromonospora haikouensis]|uniref:transposase n=1 Tax=Micromonospora haikouensis TaxID=686309 RepID=UPI003D73B007